MAINNIGSATPPPTHTNKRPKENFYLTHFPIEAAVFTVGQVTVLKVKEM